MSTTPKWFDRVQETSTTTGTGTYTLAGAVTGYRTFTSVLASGDSAYYCAFEVDANGVPSGGWEVGFGTFTTAGTTLARTTIFSSSNANAAVNWGAGTRRIFLNVPAAYVPPLDIVMYGVVLRGSQFVAVNGRSVATGDTDLYTVPTGKRAILTSYVYSNFVNIGTVTWFLQVKHSGTYYRLSTSDSRTASSASNSAIGHFIFEAGESISVNVATSNGLNFFAEVLEFDDSNALTRAAIFGLATGDQTLYTCPTGKRAHVPASSPWPNNNSPVGALGLVADAGGSRTMIIQHVPNGGSPATSNQVTSASVTASTRSNATVPVTLDAGDFININVNTGNAAQLAYTPIIERPAL